MGTERATLFALPLGLAMLLVVDKFAEHPSPFSRVINLLLISVVWWCAHRLTWDCTLIDDEEDATGEGLMQKIGLDGPASDDDPAVRGGADNEMFADMASAPARGWWRSPQSGKRPHAPGLWVLYFSLAALPMFGLGQTWIPAQDAGRRRYAFSLLAVYVAAGLALLVTTSFLGLRRYLRQRHVEMPVPMAATWIGTGAALIAVVMVTAALIPRPNAEFAISRVPWQVGSPGARSASRVNAGSEPAQEEKQAGTVVSAKEDGPRGNAYDQEDHAEQTDTGAEPNGDRKKAHGSSTGDEQDAADSDARQSPETSRGDATERRESAADRSQEDGAEPPSSTDAAKGDRTASGREDGEQRSVRSWSGGGRQSPSPSVPGPSLHSLVVGLAGMVKLVFYLVGLLVIAYLLWKHRRPLIQAAVDILGEFRALLARLFGRPGDRPAVTTGTPADEDAPRLPGFSEFRDPFVSGRHQRLSPDELVCYTFEAFEAWARDRGCPRTPDRTPRELVQMAVAPQTPMHDEARRMVGLYNELAYARGTISREAAQGLQVMWKLMRSTQPKTSAAQ